MASACRCPLSSCCACYCLQLEQLIAHPDKDPDFDAHALSIALQVGIPIITAQLRSWHQAPPITYSCFRTKLVQTSVRSLPRSRRRWPSCTTRSVARGKTRTYLQLKADPKHFAPQKAYLHTPSLPSASVHLSPRSQAGKYPPL